jgi:hypothetical protein
MTFPRRYCVPSLRHRVVLTTGAVAALEPRQLRAVIAHERAHLWGRHDLVIAGALALTGPSRGSGCSGRRRRRSSGWWSCSPTMPPPADARHDAPLAARAFGLRPAIGAALTTMSGIATATYSAVNSRRLRPPER